MMVIIMLIAILEHITTYVKEIPKLAKKTAQAVKSMITKASRNELLQNIKDSYKTTMLARNMQNYPGTRKLNDEYGGSYQSHTSRTCSNNGN